MKGTTRRMTAALAAAALASTLAACGSSSASDNSSSASPNGAAEAAQFPFTQQNAWGTTIIESRPERIAVASGGDRDIAYALGIVPVISPVYPGSFVSPYVPEAEQRLGITDPVTWDDTDSTDFEAIAATNPDVILGMNSYVMDDDYEQLAKIAPVITFADANDVADATWAERFLRAAEALGLSEKAEQVVAANKGAAADAAVAHPEFAGKTYTYVVVHPSQLTYASYADQDPGVLEDLGLVKAPNADKYTAEVNGVSLENVLEFDADILLVAFPFGDEGVISRDSLESNPLWQSIPAVQQGRWAVVDAESGLASDIAYPSALSYPWVVEQITPILAKAAAGTS